MRAAHRQFELDNNIGVHNVGEVETIELVESGGDYLRRTSSISIPNPPPPSRHSVPSLQQSPLPIPTTSLSCTGMMVAACTWVATHVLRPGIIAMVAAALLFSANTALARLITRSTTTTSSSTTTPSSYSNMCNVTVNDDANSTTTLLYNSTTNCTSAVVAATTTSKAAPYSPFQVLYLRALVVTIGCSIVLYTSGALPILMRARPAPPAAIAAPRKRSVHVIVALSPLAGSTSSSLPPPTPPLLRPSTPSLLPPVMGEGGFEEGLRHVIRVYRSHISWAFLRGLFGTIAMACSYYAVSTLPSLAEAVVLYGFNPVFSSIAARIILKEHFTIFRLLGVLLFICGVIVSVNPQKTFGEISSGGSSLEEWIARGVALVGSFFNGVAIVAAKRMVPPPIIPPSPTTTIVAVAILPPSNRNQPPPPNDTLSMDDDDDEVHQNSSSTHPDYEDNTTTASNPVGYTLHWVAQAWWQGFIGLALAPLACFVFTFSTIKSGSELDVLVLVAQGLCAFAGQCCVGFAVQRENAAIIGVLWNFDVVFAIMWQSTLLGASVSWYDGVGVVFVFLGSIVCVLEKAWMDRQKVTTALTTTSSQNSNSSPPPPTPPSDQLSFSSDQQNESKSMRSDTQPPSSQRGNPLCG